MRIFGIMAVMAACGLLFSGYVKADSASELADIKAKLASLEAQQMAPAAAGAGAGDAAALSGMRNDKARVSIGGDFEIQASAIRRSTRNNDSDKFDVTTFNTVDADINMKVTTMSPDVYLFVKLDCDDFWGGNGSDTNNCGQGDDLLEECYFTWKNIRGSAFGLQFGKKEVPFGMDIRTNVGFAYTHNDRTGSFLGSNYAADADTANNNHQQVGFTNFTHPGEIDNVFAGQVNWNYKELLSLELAVFQNNDTDAQGNRRGMHEDRSEDSLLLNSMAARAIFTPIPDLKLQLSWSMQHMDYQEDNSESTYGNDGEDAKHALSVGADYNPKKGFPLRLYIEYIHGWNQLYCDEIDTDQIQAGFAWHLIENKLDLCFDFNWLNIDNDLVAGDGDEDYYKVAVGPKYTTESGIWFGLEYAHEWYENDIANWDDADADVVSFMTGWCF